MKDLSLIRVEIDRIDSEIVRLYQQRLALTEQVASYKISVGKPVLDKQREAEKLEQLCALAETDFTRTGVRELFEQIMAMSRKKQYQLLAEQDQMECFGFEILQDVVKSPAKIVYQGVEGAYSEQAMKAYFGQQTDGYHVNTWRQAMEAIQNGEAEYAVLPIENSSAGIISENYDLLLEFDTVIVGEQTIRIENALLGLPGAELADITSVFSHEQPLLQCVDFLDCHKDWRRVAMKNTALSAKKVLEDGKKCQAAIASLRAAELYRLKVLRESINYSDENRTRFIIVTGRKVCRSRADKISICFEIRHKSGSLYQALSHLIYNDLNMNRIESRPIKDKSFEYRFFVEFDGNLTDGAVQNALRGLKEETLSLKLLGNY